MTWALAIVGLLLLAAAFIVVWAQELRFRIVMTPLLVVAAYFAIRIYPAMLFATDGPMLSTWLPFAVAICAGFSFLLGYALMNRYVSAGQPLAPKTLQSMSSSDFVMLLALVFMMILVIALGIYLYGGMPSGTVALIGVIAGDDFGSIAKAMADSRAAITKGHYFGGADRGQGLVRDLIGYAWPFTILIAAYCYSLTRKKRFALMAIVGFFVSFVFIAGDGTRAPFLNTIIIYAVGASLLRPLRMRHIGAVIGAVLLLAIVTSIYSHKASEFVSADSPVSAAFESIGRRVVLGNAINDAFAIDLIDRGILQHRGGQLHLRDFKASIPGVSAERPFSFELYQLLLQGRGTTYMTGTYLTKPYVDFGIVGVALAYLIVGGFAAALFRLLWRLPSNPVCLAATAVAVHVLAQMVLSRGVITLGPSAIVLTLCVGLFAFSMLLAQSVVLAAENAAASARVEARG